MPYFCPLASGSKGNALLFKSDQTTLLIDDGISLKKLEKGLEDHHLGIEQIDAIMITHDHIDHIGGLATLLKRFDIPVICNADTAKGIYEYFHLQPRFKIFTTGFHFTFQDLEIFPFPLPHDTLDPVGFTLQTKEIKIGICADLGIAPMHVKKSLQKCHLLYLEFNHEPSLVHASPRPNCYKTRVLGRQGHLSNKQAAALLQELMHPHLERLYLAHLSEECNREELAWEEAKRVVEKEEILAIAYQNKPSNPWIC